MSVPVAIMSTVTAMRGLYELRKDDSRSSGFTPVDFQVTTATGTAERDVVPHLIDEARLRGFHPRTLGADKAYDTREFVQCMRAQSLSAAQ